MHKVLRYQPWLRSAAFCLAAAWLLLAVPAAAQNKPQYDESGAGGLVQCGNKTTDPCTVEDIFNVFIIATNLLIGLVGLFAIFALFKGGFDLVVSSGSAEKITAGKKQLTNAIIGLLLVLLAFLLVNTIIYALIGAKSDTNIFINPLEYIGLTSGSSPAANNTAPINVPANTAPVNQR